MSWTQLLDPLHSTLLSALAAAAPLLLLLTLLASGRVKGWIAALASTGSALLVAVLLWRMPAAPALSAGLFGAAFAIFPILWILVAALWVHNLTVQSGEFEVIKASLAAMTADRRLQALVVAFSFGALLEGAAGFGVPVAVTTAMLIGLGFPAAPAAVLCLVANSTPVAFAAAGVPITVAAEVGGADLMAVTRFVALVLPLLSLCVPLLLCLILCGLRRSLEVLPAIIVAGASLAISQFASSIVLGPWATGVLSGLVTIASLALLLRFWRPRSTWSFKASESIGTAGALDPPAVSPARTLRAWSPWFLVSVLVLLWSASPVKGLLAPLGLSLNWPLLHNLALRVPPASVPASPYAAVFSFSVLSAPGSAIFLAGAASAFILPGLGARPAATCLAQTIRDMRHTILAICSLLATAFVMSYAGMSSSIGLALATTGPLFPVFSALLGWVGVVLTGSDTSSNALFCALQRTTADQLGLDPALVAAANTSGGVAGKMVSPQSLAVASASSGLVGNEGAFFRRTIGYSLAMAAIVGLLTLALSRLPKLL